VPKVKKNNFFIGKLVLEGFVNPIPGLQKTLWLVFAKTLMNFL
jgi:hypothetical protein